MRAPLLAIALSLAVTGMTWARSGEEQQARRLFERAEVHFNVGEFTQALELYKQAYKLHPLPGFIFNIGQCHRHLGEHEKAIFQFRMYLVRLPGAPNRDEAQKLIRESENALASERALRPATRAVLPDPSPPERPRRRAHRAWFWSSATLGGALLVAGAVAGGLNLSMSREYNDPSTPVPRRIELKDVGEPLGIVSGVTLGLGGALAAASIALYFYTDFGSPSARRVAFTPLPGGGTIVVGGGF